MNILVTGVAGFIGFSLSKKLLTNHKNIKLYGLDNLNNYYSLKLKKKRIAYLKKFKNFEFKKIDLKNFNELKKIFLKKKFDFAFHFAAQAGVVYSISQPRKYLDSNIIGFFNFLECCKIKRPKKIFYASSSSVYGNSKNFPLKENQPINPINYYGLTKKNNEEVAEIYSNFYGLNLIGLRFFTVYGEWGRPDMVIFKLLKSSFTNKIFNLNNNGNHYRDFTYIDDVTSLIDKLRFKKLNKNHEIFNICSNNPVKLTYLIQLSKKYKLNLKYKMRSFQKADIYKTHGCNKKVIKKTKYKNFIKIEDGFLKCINWFKKFGDII